MNDDTREFGCAGCFGDDAAAAWSHELTHESSLYDRSHQDVAIKRCADCNQAFVQLWTEVMNPTSGDDSMYSDRLPLTDEEIEAIAALPPAPLRERIMKLGRSRRQLQHDEHGPRWSEGPLFILSV